MYSILFPRVTAYSDHLTSVTHPDSPSHHVMQYLPFEGREDIPQTCNTAIRLLIIPAAADRHALILQYQTPRCS
jgi:hypothetical protein